MLRMDGYRECTERKDDGHERGSVLHELSPEDTTKVLCIKKAVHPKKQETLAEYYVRIDGHLLRDVKVLKWMSRQNKSDKKLKCIGQYFGSSSCPYVLLQYEIDVDWEKLYNVLKNFRHIACLAL